MLLDLIPSITVLKDYKPLLKEFLQDGVFDSLDQRYFKLSDRSNCIDELINWDMLNKKGNKGNIFK